MEVIAKHTLFVVMISFLSFPSHGFLLEKPHLGMSFRRLDKISLGGEGADDLDRQKTEEVLEEKYRNLYARTPNKKWSFEKIELWLQAPEKAYKKKSQLHKFLLKST